MSRPAGTAATGVAAIALPIAALVAVMPFANAGNVDDWRRHPVATAPPMEKAPVIDGALDRAEWQTAAQLGPFKVMRDGVADGLARDVYVGYDRDNLYIGFRLERPAGALEPGTPTRTGHADTWSGDMFELALDTNHNHKDYYDFVLFANGAYSEGHGRPGVDKGWDCAWRRAASRTDRGWQGEMAIPFASLGLEAAPKPGDVWGLDAADIWRTPYKQVAQWAYRGGWHFFDNFGHLRFGGKAPAVRFAQAADAGGKAVVEFGLVNATGTDANLKGHVRLLKRKPGAEGGPKSYYPNVESGSDRAYATGKAEFEKSTKLPDLIRDALRFYAPVKGAEVRADIALPSGRRRAFGVAAPGDVGEYLAVYEFVAGDGARLAAGVAPFRVEAPLALTLAPYWLRTQVIDVTADLRKVTLAGKAQLTFAILDAASGKALAQDTVTVRPNAVRATGALPTKGLKPGFYKVRAVLSRDGKELAVNTQSVEKPETPVWYANDFGKLDVPKPWTPIKAARNGVVEVWDRTYDLSAVFPKRITSQGKPALAAPVRFSVTSGGRTLPWKVSRLARKRVGKGRAVYEVSMTTTGARIEGSFRVEFDGLVWYDLRLVPAEGGLRVARMSLQIDIPAERAELLETHKFYPMFGEKPRKIKRGGAGGLGPVPSAARIPFTPYLWMGDETGGLAFVAEAPIDWKVKDPYEVFQIVPGGPKREPAGFRIHLIDHPVTLTRPMRLQFGLQASPIRPMPREDVTHVFQMGGPSLNEETYRKMAEGGATAVVYHGGWKNRNKQKEWSGWPSRPSDPERRKALKAAIGLAHKYGLKVMLYTGWGVAADSDEWKRFGPEMCRVPIENSGFGTYRQSAGLQGAYIDYMAWAIADLVKEYGADGVFWDSASNLQPDRNLRIGNAWVDEKGKVRPKYAVLATRELFRRVYSLTHGQLKDDGVCVNFGGSVWCVNVYADVMHRGEGPPMHARTLRDCWVPLEEYRASYDGRKFGVPFLAMNKNFKRLPMRVNNHHAVTLLHGSLTKATSGVWKARYQNYKITGMPHVPIWLARKWLPFDETTRWLTFYKDQTAVKPAKKELLASAFVSGDGKRALVVVSNLDKEKISAVNVALDRKELGFPPGVRLKMEDAILRKPVALQGDAFRIDIEPERFRLLKLWRE